METSQKTNINDFDRKYKFDMGVFTDAFRIQKKLDGPESLSEFRSRCRRQIASYYAANCLLRRRSPYVEALALGLSVRSIQRYWSEFPLSDQVLDLIYHIQITQL